MGLPNKDRYLPPEVSARLSIFLSPAIDAAFSHRDMLSALDSTYDTLFRMSDASTTFQTCIIFETMRGNLRGLLWKN